MGINEDKLAEGQCDSPATCAEERKKGISEDWLSVWLGLFIFFLSFIAFSGFEIFGWAIKTNVWTDTTKIMSPLSAKFTQLPGIVSLILTYFFMLVILSVGAKAIGANLGKFIGGFTLVFFISYICWAIGHYAYIAATPNQLLKFSIPWSMNLTGEAGFIVALIAGLIVGNFIPGLANAMKEAIRPELYIKTAIVILGAGLGVKGAEALGLASPSCSGGSVRSSKPI